MLNAIQRELLISGLNRISVDIERLTALVRNAAGPLAPIRASLEGFTRAIAALQEVVGNHKGSDSISPPTHFNGLLRTILTDERRKRAGDLERYRENLVDHELILALEAQLKPFDALARAPWFHEVKPARLPRLSDFLTLESVAKVQATAIIPPPVYDDKFRVLRAPSQVTTVMCELLSECGMRGAALGLVFLDIDDFKKFNTAYTEPIVDRDVLPNFFRAIDRVVFGHGYAFRHGGDEVVLLIPNATLELSLAILDRLRAEISALRFPMIELQACVSMGLCLLEPESPLTEREALLAASRAKRYAKMSGKNAVAAYSTNLFRDEDLVLVRGRSVEGS
jgi:diguanylate cyclase (GGDEF)-like protein